MSLPSPRWFANISSCPKLAFNVKVELLVLIMLNFPFFSLVICARLSDKKSSPLTKWPKKGKKAQEGICRNSSREDR